MRPSERDAAYLWDMLEAARNVASLVAGKNLDRLHSRFGHTLGS